jgi:D-beta-D-heptose 7-phosphate kinase/D-beta-D-heptose 1-phosphate adenosyltransferase
MPPHSERDLLARLPGVRVLVIGDAMLDRHLIGQADRISPEAPVPIVRVTERRITAGGAANVATNVTAAGGSCTLVGVVGADTAGTELRATLQAARVRDLTQVVRDRPTTTKSRVVARGQQVIRIDEERESPISAEDRALIAAAASDALAEAQVLVFEDYDKGVCTPPLIRLLLGAAQQRGLPVVVDPKIRQFFDYPGATVFKPNRRELAAALGPGTDLQNPVTLTKARERLDAEHLLVTLGSDGMVLAGPKGLLTRIPARAREVFDISGAGDTITAWVAMGIAAGGDMLTVARLAAAAAGVAVGKRGVATVTSAEVLAALG